MRAGQIAIFCRGSTCAVVLFVGSFVAFNSKLVDITLYRPVYMPNMVSVLARCAMVGFAEAYKH